MDGIRSSWGSQIRLRQLRGNNLQRKGCPSSPFNQLALRPGLGYNEVNWCLISSNAYSEAGAGRSEASTILHTRAGEGARGGAKLGVDQWAYLLKKYHRWLDCRRYSAGKPPVRPPNCMPPGRNFPPTPTKKRRGENSDEKRNKTKAKHF